MRRLYTIDDPVIVSNPKYKDSIHEREFVGVVVGVSPIFYEVRDSKDDVYPVYYDEIEGLQKEYLNETQ